MFVKKIEVYSFAKNKAVEESNGLLDGAMKITSTLNFPIEVGESLEERIAFLKKLNFGIGPKRFYILHGFDFAEEWDNYEEELRDFYNGDLEDEPSSPDHDAFMLPLDYKDEEDA